MKFKPGVATNKLKKSSLIQKIGHLPFRFNGNPFDQTKKILVCFWMKGETLKSVWPLPQLAYEYVLDSFVRGAQRLNIGNTHDVKEICTSNGAGQIYLSQFTITNLPFYKITIFRVHNFICAPDRARKINSRTKSKSM